MISVVEGTRETIRWLNRDSWSLGERGDGLRELGCSSLEPKARIQSRPSRMVRSRTSILFMEGIVAYFLLRYTMGKFDILDKISILFSCNLLIVVV